MSINREQVEHVALLARLNLSEDELARLTGDLQAILGFSEVRAQLEEDLADFGFAAVPTRDRLRAFDSVENTYLAAFQALGGLGLMLGTLGLGAVVLRNVFERRAELALLRVLGFTVQKLRRFVVTETFLLLGLGLGCGTLCALVAVWPHIQAQAEVDTYEVFIVGGDSFTTIVLNGPGDYKLELLTSTDTLLATSDRGGLGIEEVIQYATGFGTFKVRVTVQESIGTTSDVNGDGTVNVLDLIDLLLCYGQPGAPGCEAEDVNCDGTVNVLDLIDLLLKFGSSVPAENEYVLEVLSRSS